MGCYSEPCKLMDFRTRLFDVKCGCYHVFSFLFRASEVSCVCLICHGGILLIARCDQPHRQYRACSTSLRIFRSVYFMGDFPIVSLPDIPAP